MQHRSNQMASYPPARPRSETGPQNGAALTAKEIPYDYIATFTLEGRRGNRVQDVINISIDGAFIAVAIGYSFIPARLPALSPDTLAQLLGALGNFRELVTDVLDDPRLPVQCLLTNVCGISFKYSIVDSATGRELQNQPIHNIAGLGESTGNRPFRPLAKPILFEPRSTIRIEVEEISEGPIYGYNDPTTGQRVGAELYIALHGYKKLR